MLLEPALQAPNVHLICRESPLDGLLIELSSCRLGLVLSEARALSFGGILTPDRLFPTMREYGILPEYQFFALAAIQRLSVADTSKRPRSAP